MSTRNVPGTRLYRLMRMYRLSLLDAIADMTAIIELASMHKRFIVIDTTELLTRKDAVAAMYAIAIALRAHLRPLAPPTQR